jgi:cell division protein FtsB
MSKKFLWLLGILALLIIFFPGFSRLQTLKQKNQLLRQQIEALEKENRELAVRVERLENDPFFIEKAARDKMGIGREGEIRYKIIYEGSANEQRTDD